ncbi:putative phage abortive infection protein [Citrobacter braakii]
MKTSRLIYFVLIALASILVVVGLYAYNFHGPLSASNSDWGTFGDYFGGVLNPFFGFLSLMAILATIALQSAEMELTRKELERAARAQEKSEVVLNAQARTQVRQQFEGTFFSLLNEHNKALQEISSPDLGEHRGLSRVDDLYGGVFYNTLNLSQSRSAFAQNNRLCGKYFRILYQILKFIAVECPGGSVGEGFESEDIKRSTVSRSEKMYANMVRAFIPDKVLQLLAINCACDSPVDAFWKFKLLLERYEFLEHMPFDIEEHEGSKLEGLTDIYDPSVFGSSIYLTDDEA